MEANRRDLKMTEEEFEKMAVGEYMKLTEKPKLPVDKIVSNPEKPKCPECLQPTDQDELDMFGGLCEECSGAFDED